MSLGVFTGDNKGKTSAAIGLMARALGADFKVAFVQFIKSWEVSEHKFIKNIMPIYQDKLVFYKGGLGFYNAGEISSKASEQDHKNDGLLKFDDLKNLINDKHQNTSLCLTGRNFPNELLELTDIATNMTKLKHHYDDKILASEGIDY